MKIAIATVLCLLGFAARAQTNTLTLAEAKRVAFERNWDLLASRSGVDAAMAQWIVTKEFPNPTASWSSAKIGAHENSSSVGNGVWDRNYDTIVAINQLIEIAGKRRDRQTAARAGVAGAKARFYDAKRTLDQGVTKAYIAALLTHENARILNQSADLLQHEADIAQQRRKAGDLSEADMNQIAINAEQFELQAKSAEAAAVQARIAVEILMGTPQPKGDWTPADSLDQLVATAGPVKSMATPDMARPDVLAAKADLENAVASLRLQRAERIPDPTFLVEYEHDPPNGAPPYFGPPADSIGVGFSFPLPLWNRNGGNIRAAQAAVDQFEDALEKAKMQAGADLANARVEYHEACNRWVRYRDVTAPKAAQVRSAIAFAYDKGGVALLDLLDAERTDNDIRLATAQAMADTASAMADLVAAQTVLTETELKSLK